MGKHKRSKVKIIHPQWFFMWTGTNYIITTICSYHRNRAIVEAERFFSDTWRNLYSRGGRIIKVKIIPLEGENAKKV